MKRYFLIFLIFLIAAPVFAAEKTQDVTFSLSGKSINGKFNIAGDFLFAQEFRKRFFVQAAGFVNNKEYGGSFGLGVLTDEGGDIYVFADSIYAYDKVWTQVRPTVRLRLSWLSLTGFYALPLSKSTIKVDEQEVRAVQYWGGEINLVPVSWARVYGDVMSVNKTLTYKFGAEVRILKWFSLLFDWNKSNPDICSKRNNQDFGVAINVLLGNQQKSFSSVERIQVTPMYPILTTKAGSGPPDPWLVGGEIEIQYRQLDPIVDPNANVWISTYHDRYGGLNASKPIKTGEKTWVATIHLQCDPQPYWIFVNDYQVANYHHPIARELSVRRKGDSQWILATCVVVDPFNLGGEAVKVIFSGGKLRIPTT